MIRAILFDFDGVMVESHEIKTAAFSELFAHEGAEVAARVAAYHLGNGGVSRYEKIRHIYREILRRPLGADEFHALCERFGAMVRESVAKAPAVRGARRFLEGYSSLYECFIVSATPQEELEGILRELDLFRHFRSVYGAPIDKAEIVGRILKDRGYDPGEVVYIGDSRNDHVAASKNRVTFVARLTRENDSFFGGIDCLKVADLENLESLVGSL